MPRPVHRPLLFDFNRKFFKQAMILISDDGCNLLGFKGNMNRIRGFKCTNDMGKNALAKTINDIPILSHNFFLFVYRSSRLMHKVAYKNYQDENLEFLIPPPSKVDCPN